VAQEKVEYKQHKWEYILHELYKKAVPQHTMEAQGAEEI
jgi:hypothetical protein